MESFSQEASKAVAAYPVAETGEKRWVMYLPQQEDRAAEDGLQLQVRVGVEAKVDGANSYSLAGQLKAHTVEGWGYCFYRYEGLPEVASTRMGNKGAGAGPAMVWAQAELISYNSRLPVVVYTQKHMRVSYRVLQATSEYGLAAQG